VGEGKRRLAANASPEPTRDHSLAVGEAEPSAPREPSVNDIPDTELLCRVVRSRGYGRKGPRWVRVSRLFGLGSTYASQLCRRFGCDPEEQVGQ
jgi:hypothetical protein